ncbi:MAG: HAD family hydrolase [Gemmatimonadales bacterium]|nr:MAG: HAD family hydrolase [Gemmatimonadales bacterium]
MIEYLLFDLDDTVYPKSSGLGEAMNSLMTDFVADYRGVSTEEAAQLRKQSRDNHGTTLAWLIGDHGLTDVESFLEAVHPADLSGWLDDDMVRDIQNTLSQIDLQASILTKSPGEHAERVLSRLGIRGRFDYVFDLRHNGFQGKPARAAYTRALAKIGVEAEHTLFVDDVIQYLLPFRELGGRIVHMSPSARTPLNIPSIRTLGELASHINPERGDR